MDNENLKRKLSLFYHPLFQNIVQQWFLAFKIPQNSMNLISFLEINLKIQKVILAELEIDDSLSSGLTDWIREIASLTTKATLSSQDLKNKELPIEKSVKKMIQEIPFNLSLSEAIYCHFLESQSARLDASVLIDKLALQGFAKFLFDLCYSWCEDLDIELFTMFLLSVLYLSADFYSAYQLRSKTLNEITTFPDLLLTQIKLLKAHYQKYKKVDLLSYEKFYEWNYLPNRLKETKNKVIETFKCLPHDNNLLNAHIETVFQSSLFQIMQKDLSKPTTTHFAVFPKDNKGIRGPQTSIDYDNCPEMIPPQSQRSYPSKPKVIKKIQPGAEKKENGENEQEEQITIHTLTSIDPFVEEDDDLSPGKGGLFKKSQLFPIWENEFSEMNSLVTTHIFDKPVFNEETNANDESLLKEILPKDPNIHKKKEEKILRLNILYRGSTPKERMRPIEELLVKSPTNFLAKVPTREGRTSVSPKLLQARRKHQQASPDKNVQNEGIKKEIKVNMNMILSERSTDVRALTPGHRTHRKIVLSPASTINDTSNEMIRKEHGNVRVIKYFGVGGENTIKPNSANRAKARPKIHKDASFESLRQKSARRINKLNLTGINKSNEQSLEDESTALSPKNKYCLDFQPIQKEEILEGYEKIEVKDKSEKRRKAEKLRFLAFGKTSRINISPRMGMNNEEFNFIKDRRNITFEESGSDPLKSPTLDIYSQLAKRMKDESYTSGNCQKYENPKNTLNNKSGFLNMRKALADYVSGMEAKEKEKEPKEHYDRMKSKVEKNKRNQEIRMKLVNKTEGRKNVQTGFLGVNMIERKKLENSLLNDFLKGTNESSLE